MLNQLVAWIVKSIRPQPEQLIWKRCWQDTSVEVWERPGRRELRFGNRVVQSAQSQLNPEHLVLRYTRYLLLGLVVVPQPQRILHIGMGAGTVPTYLHRHFPDLIHDVVELNPEVIAAARECFDFPDHPHLQVHLGNALEQVPQLPGPYDLIFLDAFDSYGTPPALQSPEFLSLLLDRLTPNGWVLANVWSATEVFPQFRKRWMAAFGRGMQARTRSLGNVLLFGSHAGPEIGRAELLKRAHLLQRQLPQELVGMARKLERWDPS